jgi:outer membrane lipoprotein carrier protein
MVISFYHAFSSKSPAVFRMRRSRTVRRPVATIPTLIAITSALIGPIPLRAYAQTKALDDARSVAASVQSFYDQTRDISASFFQTYFHALYRRTEKTKGKVVFEKPGKMRWDYDLPNGKIIVSDGSKLKIYEPGDRGEAGQVLEQSLKDAQLPQALSFLMGTGRLEESFTFRLLDSKKEGFPSGHVLELQPLKPNPHYARVVFYVESDPRLRGLVRRVLIIDHNGNRNRFDFTKLEFNRKVSGALFSWNPPAGTRLVKP